MLDKNLFTGVVLIKAFDCIINDLFIAKRHSCGLTFTAQKIKFSIKDFFNKCDQIRRKLRIWSHLRKKSLMKNFIFCAVIRTYRQSNSCNWLFLLLSLQLCCFHTRGQYLDRALKITFISIFFWLKLIKGATRDNALSSAFDLSHISLMCFSKLSSESIGSPNNF